MSSTPSPQALRASIRSGEHGGNTSGYAPGFVQCNIVILPADWANDFLRFCQLNPKPCPLIAASAAPGDPTLPPLGDIDIRTDVPSYRVFRDGEMTEETADISQLWRDDLVTFHVDGTLGSAVAGLHSCKTQSRVNTPKPVWNPDEPQKMNFFDDWVEVPNNQIYDNGFKVQWEGFIRHLYEDTPWEYDLLSGAKGVQLAELGLKSWDERRWLDVPDLKI